ncbi:hypothetical protein RSAG8_13561, partial [Rhizoctonia solani AG-8 WAC10335]
MMLVGPRWCRRIAKLSTGGSRPKGAWASRTCCSPTHSVQNKVSGMIIPSRFIYSDGRTHHCTQFQLGLGR